MCNSFLSTGGLVTVLQKETIFQKEDTKLHETILDKHLQAKCKYFNNFSALYNVSYWNNIN